MAESSTIQLNAINWKNKNDFYSSYCEATTAPGWFGKNLSALADSFVGGICKITPEKIIVRNLSSKIKENIGYRFWADVEEICQTNEVELEIHTN